jgi:hypothetical protein
MSDDFFRNGIFFDEGLRNLASFRRAEESVRAREVEENGRYALECHGHLHMQPRPSYSPDTLTLRTTHHAARLR